MKLREQSVLCLATGCFVGNIPFAPGTMGSIAALPLCYLLSKTGLTFSVLFIMMFVFFAIRIADRASRILHQDDPGCIVIDEIAGMAITLIGLPFDPLTVVSGFFLFRFLDILKPFPIRYIEKTCSGGAGIVLDDVAAGIIGHIVLRTVLVLLG